MKDVKDNRGYFWSLDDKDDVEWEEGPPSFLLNETLGECKMAWIFNEELVFETSRETRIQKIQELISKLEKIGL